MSAAAASMKDLKVGDRVVIHAEKMGDKLIANEVHFGVVAKNPSAALSELSKLRSGQRMIWDAPLGTKTSALKFSLRSTVCQSLGSR